MLREFIASNESSFFLIKANTIDTSRPLKSVFYTYDFFQCSFRNRKGELFKF